jgi:hypothetical protein
MEEPQCPLSESEYAPSDVGRGLPSSGFLWDAALPPWSDAERESAPRSPDFCSGIGGSLRLDGVERSCVQRMECRPRAGTE